MNDSKTYLEGVKSQLKELDIEAEVRMASSMCESLCNIRDGVKLD